MKLLYQLILIILNILACSTGHALGCRRTGLGRRRHRPRSRVSFSASVGKESKKTQVPKAMGVDDIPPPAYAERYGRPTRQCSRIDVPCERPVHPKVNPPTIRKK